MRKILFTPQGYKDLKDKLDKEQSKRPGAVASLQKGREMGDLSENGLYKAAKFELGNIDRSIRRLKNILSHAEIVKPDNSSEIKIGHAVKVKDGQKEKFYMIVGDFEADPKENKVSTKSPVGKALINKKIGDKVEIETPAGKTVLEVISID